MNILYISHDKNMSGASRSLVEIISRLEEKHNIFVLVPTNKGPFFEELRKHNCRIISKPYFLWVTTKTTKLKWILKKIRWFSFGWVVNNITAHSLVKIVRDNQIDLIHTNTGVTEIGARISKLTKIKHVWHIREFADLDFHMFPLPQMRSYRKYLNECADVTVFNSYAVARHYSFITSKKLVIYNGIDSRYIIDDSDKIPHDGINILISGRISKDKGQWQAIEACKNLLKENVSNFCLYIAGEGNLDYSLDELGRHIVLLGSVEDMVGLRKRMDIELVCSVAEAFGRVTVEAMFAGLAVIGSKSGGTIELIDDGITGLLYEQKDINDLKDKIKMLISKDNVRNALRKNGKKYATGKFTIDILVKNIFELYESLLNDKSCLE